MREFGRAVHRAARWLDGALPTGLAPGTVVAILSTVSPLVYHAVVVALVRLDLVPALGSPILAVPTATQRLLEAYSCTTVLVSAPVPVIAASLAALDAAGHTVRKAEMPTVGALYPRLGRETASDPFDPLRRSRRSTRPPSTSVRPSTVTRPAARPARPSRSSTRRAACTSSSPATRLATST